MDTLVKNASENLGLIIGLCSLSLTVLIFKMVFSGYLKVIEDQEVRSQLVGRIDRTLDTAEKRLTKIRAISLDARMKPQDSYPIYRYPMSGYSTYDLTNPKHIQRRTKREKK